MLNWTLRVSHFVRYPEASVLLLSVLTITNRQKTPKRTNANFEVMLESVCVSRYEYLVGG
jgi:hypothetical protein